MSPRKPPPDGDPPPESRLEKPELPDPDAVFSEMTAAEVDQLRHKLRQARLRFRQLRDRRRHVRQRPRRRQLQQRLERLSLQIRVWNSRLEQQSPALPESPFAAEEAERSQPNAPRELVDHALLEDFLTGNELGRGLFLARYQDRMLEACRLCLLGMVDPRTYAGQAVSRAAYYILPPEHRSQLVELAQEVVAKALDSAGFRQSLREVIETGRQITAGYLLGAVVRNLTVANIQPIRKRLALVPGKPDEQEALGRILAQRHGTRPVTSRRDWKQAFLAAGFHEWEFEYLWYRFENWPVVATRRTRDGKDHLSVQQVLHDLDQARAVLRDNPGTQTVSRQLRKILQGLQVRIEGRASTKAAVYALNAVEEEVKKKWPMILQALGLEKCAAWRGAAD